MTLHRDLTFPLPGNGVIVCHTLTGQLQGSRQGQAMERPTGMSVRARPDHARSAWCVACAQQMLEISNPMETCQSPLKIRGALMFKIPQMKILLTSLFLTEKKKYYVLMFKNSKEYKGYTYSKISSILPRPTISFSPKR